MNRINSEKTLWAQRENSKFYRNNEKHSFKEKRLKHLNPNVNSPKLDDDNFNASKISDKNTNNTTKILTHQTAFSLGSHRPINFDNYKDANGIIPELDTDNSCQSKKNCSKVQKYKKKNKRKAETYKLLKKTTSQCINKKSNSLPKTKIINKSKVFPYNMNIGYANTPKKAIITNNTLLSSKNEGNQYSKYWVNRIFNQSNLSSLLTYKKVVSKTPCNKNRNKVILKK